MKIVSGILSLITVYLNFKHAWSGLSGNYSPEEAKMLSELGVNKSLSLVVSILSVAVGILVLFPQTFFVGNLLNAILIVSIMALATQAHALKTALIEIPFLLMPLVLIWLGHPFENS